MSPRLVSITDEPLIPIPKTPSVFHYPAQRNAFRRDACQQSRLFGRWNPRPRPRKDHRGVDLISDALPFGRLWYGEPNAAANAVGYAKFNSRSYDAVIRVFDAAGKVIETREQARI